LLNAYPRRNATEAQSEPPLVEEGPNWGLERARRTMPTLRLLVPGLTVEQLEFVGQGREGSVYRIDADRCVKFSKRKHREEVASLEQGQGSPFFPKLHYAGRDFMLREYIDGLPLNHYLRRHPLTRSLSAQLIELFNELRRLGFKRRDMRLSHIIVTPGGKVRIIDPTNLNKDRRDFPRKFFKGMRRRKWADTFISHIREIDPEMLQRWSRYLRLPPAPAPAPAASPSSSGADEPEAER
jgi:predicted Ser/Thr protein kinase